MAHAARARLGGARAGAGLSGKAGAHPRALRARRRGRYQHPHPHAEDERAPGLEFVIENRPGGNGFIATTAVAKSAADGYTLLMAHTGEFAVNPALFDNVPYELERDFVPITMVSDAPMLYLARAAAPFNTFQELVREA